MSTTNHFVLHNKDISTANPSFERARIPFLSSSTYTSEQHCISLKHFCVPLWVSIQPLPRISRWTFSLSIASIRQAFLRGSPSVVPPCVAYGWEQQPAEAVGRKTGGPIPTARTAPGFTSLFLSLSRPPTAAGFRRRAGLRFASVLHVSLARSNWHS